MAEAPKRVHDPPTGQTPGKKQPKRRSTSGRFLKRSLFQSDTDELVNKVAEKDTKINTTWSDEELSALVEYIALYHSPDEDSSCEWPLFKNEEFWEKCAAGVNCVNIGKKQTGLACRSVVRRFLKEKFKTIADAEEAYGICYFGEKDSSHVGQKTPSTPFVISGQTAHTSARSPLLGFSPLRDTDAAKLPGCILDVVSSGFMKLSCQQREQLLNHFVANRAVIPQRGQLSVHTAHFKPAERLPPMPPS